MIDNTSIVIQSFELAHLFSGKTDSVTYRGITFDPIIKKGQIICWRAELNNLRLSLIKDQLRISNSIHKYFHRNNYSDFTYKQLIQAFNQLSESLGIDLLNAKVKRLEYGCNIPLHDVMPLINNIISIKAKYFMPMNSNSVIYGKKLDLNDYSVKLYDKQFEVKKHNKIRLPQPLLRYEKVVKRMRYLHKKGIHIHTVEDLLVLDNLQALADDLTLTFRQIEKTNIIEFNKLDLEGLKKYCLLQNPNVLAYATKNHRRSVNRYKNEIRAIESNEYYNEIQDRMEERFQILLKGYFQTCNIHGKPYQS
ncbi:hypothetical protein [Sunxiuqinia sp. sy24]|uniref:hypothetical protein n=1 Tax=Sunxiuqinia sp. sy24 TaxID=3461495 RepID=UPI004045CECE